MVPVGSGCPSCAFVFRGSENDRSFGARFHRPELIHKASSQSKTLAMKTTVPMEVHSMALVGLCVRAFGRTKSYGTSTVEV
jgi:hypothetical protein